MPRSLQEIIERAEELADRFENTNPDEFVNDPVLLLAHRRRLAIAAEALDESGARVD